MEGLGRIRKEETRALYSGGLSEAEIPPMLFERVE